MKVFLSYTREKDQFSAASDLVARFQNELRLYRREAGVFQDTKIIRNGDNLTEEIKKHLSEASALLILVSPAWFQSAWCVREFEYFCSEKNKQGRQPCILLLHVVRNPYAFASNKVVADRLKKLQHTDWHDLRLKPWSDEDKLRTIADLAETAFHKVYAQERAIEKKANRQMRSTKPKSQRVR